MDASAPSPEELLEHADWLGRLARALVGDAAADDLVQETYEVALTQPPRREGPLRPWLAGVARNVARMRARGRARRERREGDADAPTEAPSPEELLARVETQQLVARIVVELDEPFRSTLLLRYYEGLSAAEIARAQAIPAGTVRWRLKEALDRVRATLDARHAGDRRRWAVMLVPIAKGVAVKTSIKLTAGAAVVVALVVGARLLGWWGAGAEPAAATRPADAPPAADVRNPDEGPAGAALTGAGPSREQPARDDDPKGALRLEGQVIDEREQGVGGARVAIDANPPIVVTTEGDGSFVFEGLIARDYRLEATDGEGYAGPARLRLGPDTEPVTLRLRPGGVVTVAVTEAGTDAPVAGADVELRSTLLYTAKTGADGLATLRGVGPTWAPLAARAPGFAPAAIMISTSGDPAAPDREAIALSRGAAVSGRVLDEAGAPIEGARVVATPASEPFPVIDPRRDAVATRADGGFNLPVVAAGSYRLTATHPSYGPTTTEPFLVDGKHPRDGLEVRLGAGGTVTGVVRDGAGKPVAAADVRVVATGHIWWRPRRQAFTDARGRFTIAGLPRRAAEVVAWHPAGASAIVPVDLAAQPKHTVELTLDVTGAIEGVVVDKAGEPIGDAQVVADPVYSGGVEDRAAWSVRGVQELVTDAGGRFRFTGLPDGAYRLRAGRPDASEATLWLGASVEARPGDPPVTITLPEAGAITGKVVLAGGGAPRAFTAEVGGTTPLPFAGEDGAFTITAPGGTHTLTIAGAGFVTRRVRGVEVADGETTDLGTITVEAGRAVSGRVLGPDGAPVPGARVAAGPLLTGGGAELYIEDESPGARSAETDEAGRFTIDGFGPGAIVVVAGKEGVGRSPSVSIPRGPASATVDLVLAPTGGLDGKVTRAGAPLADTVIIANPIGAVRSNFFVVSGADGTFTFDALNPGTYLVYPMIGGGGSRPKDMVVTATQVGAGARGAVSIDATPGPGSLIIDVAAPMAALMIVQAKVDAPNLDLMRDGSWIPPEMLSGGTVMMYMRMASGGPVEIDGIRPGYHTVCAAAIAGRPDPDTIGETPMTCVGVDVTTAKGQRVAVTPPAP